ncbi:putative transporter [Podosphaera aphanis]|nr:putative transporter [Podosphaera aphanis]
MCYISYAAAISSCLCAGSINVYSLYGHLFQERLKFTQIQVNTASVAAELALYLSASGFGFICDRFGPGPLSFASAILYLIGYLLAAFTYNNGSKVSPGLGEAQGSTVWIMVIAFVLIGLATAMMYLSAVTTCAKNFGKGKHKGFAMASPIAAFGLSGLWQSQVGTRILYEHLPDGSRGDVDVFKFFLFLAILLFAVGFVGTFLLRIVDTDDLILEVDEERSRLLENTQGSSCQRSYGSTCDESNDRVAEAQRIIKVKEDSLRKMQFHNQLDKNFLKDHTMWWLAAGFFLVSGPGEAFCTNLGTILGTLHPLHSNENFIKTTAGTQISVVAITSTVARIVFGSLTDFLAPSPTSNHNTSINNIVRKHKSPFSLYHLTISRVSFLIGSALLLSIGQVLLATGLIQNHAERFWIISSLIGCGYGAIFSLTPLIIGVIWGVENFGTNWGIIAMVPALGATFWSLIYSIVYQMNAQNRRRPDDEHDVFCFGKSCYSATFWAMSVSVWAGCLFWLWAWKGQRGWTSRGLYV